MKFELERLSFLALHYKDTKNDSYTLVEAQKGGPIIEDPSLDAAKYKFENALRLASAVRNLLYFRNSTKARPQKKLRFPNSKIADVVYHELTV
jgi:hypothetical protein